MGAWLISPHPHPKNAATASLVRRDFSHTAPRDHSRGGASKRRDPCRRPRERGGQCLHDFGPAVKARKRRNNECTGPLRRVQLRPSRPLPRVERTTNGTALSPASRSGHDANARRPVPGFTFDRLAMASSWVATRAYETWRCDGLVPRGLGGVRALARLQPERCRHGESRRGRGGRAARSLCGGGSMSAPPDVGAPGPLGGKADGEIRELVKRLHTRRAELLQAV